MAKTNRKSAITRSTYAIRSRPQWDEVFGTHRVGEMTKQAFTTFLKDALKPGAGRCRDGATALLPGALSIAAAQADRPAGLPVKLDVVTCRSLSVLRRVAWTRGATDIALNRLARTQSDEVLANDAGQRQDRSLGLPQAGYFCCCCLCC